MRYSRGALFKPLVVPLIFLILLFWGSFSALYSASQPAEKKIKGQVTAVAVTIQTITVQQRDQRINIKWDKDTVFRHIDPAKIREIQGQEVEVTYVEVGGQNIAKVIALAVVEVPPGAKEIKTSELAKLIAEKPGTYVLIDSRPSARYRASYIPTAINLPISVMERLGEASLPFPKDKTLIFYCGGVT